VRSSGETIKTIDRQKDGRDEERNSVSRF
jgi:hypothetical protein